MNEKVNRRQLIGSAACATAAFVETRALAAQTVPDTPKTVRNASPFVTAKDGTKLFVQDWGSGRPVVFLSAWTFHSNVWGSHIAALTARGFRCVAPDRRGHGRSDAPAAGYELNTLVDDLSVVMEQLDLQDATLVAHSMGSIEAVRYCAGPGARRIARLMLAAPVTPFLTRTADNPEGIPSAAIEAQHEAVAKDFPKWIAENEEPFFTPDTPAETRAWIKSMMLSVSAPVALACSKSIAAADLRADLGRITCPTLIVHGDRDASAPLPITGARTARLIANSRLVVYPKAPHGLVLTHKERFLSDLLHFIEA